MTAVLPNHTHPSVLDTLADVSWFILRTGAQLAGLAGFFALVPTLVFGAAALAGRA